MNLEPVDTEPEAFVDMPNTIHEQPKPPKPKPPVIIPVVVPDDVEDDPVEFLPPDEPLEVLPDFDTGPPPVEEPVDDFFDIVEENASFPGGKKAYAKYLKKNLRYPRQARRMGIEGKVYVQFIINRDGSLVDVHVVKGIGAGCDEEALRVIKNSPKWNPGKQRGRAVRQRMVIPIVFRLN